MKSRILFSCLAFVCSISAINAQVNCPPHLPLTLVGNTTYCVGSPGSQLNVDELYAGYEWLPTTETGQSVLLDAGTYEVVVTHYTGCTDTLQFEVEQVSNPPQPTVTANGPTQFCAGGSVVLSGPEGYPYYEWSTGSVSDEITVFESGTFLISVIDWIGCSSSSNSVQVIVDPLPTAAFSPNLVGFDIEFVNQSQDATDYEWHFGDGSTSTDFEPVYSYSSEGPTDMYLVASNSCGSDTAFLTLGGVGIDELSFSELSVYPNPASGMAYVSFESEYAHTVSISLIDLVGRTVMESSSTVGVGYARIELNLESQNSGAYYLRLQSNTGGVITQLIVQ